MDPYQASSSVSYEELLGNQQQISESESWMHSHVEQQDPMSGLLEYNKIYQIRTGIIQDPSYETFLNRYDAFGNLVVSSYSALDSTPAQYPFNGINAIDVYGYRVSVLWIDGGDGGIYQNVTSDSTIQQPVQQLILTFPQIWSDLDRNCGDMSLPIVGTVCRIGMCRGNVGIYLGALPMDRAKMPILRLGDFLRRHFNQNSHYITDQTVQVACNTVLDKNIYSTPPILDVRPDVIPFLKPYELDPLLLGALREYTDHRIVQGSDGIFISAKIISGVHSSVDNQRVSHWTTNQSLLNAILSLQLMLTETGAVSNSISTPEGTWFSVKTETGYITNLITNLLMVEAETLVLTLGIPNNCIVSAADGIKLYTVGFNSVTLNNTGEIDVASPSLVTVVAPTIQLTGAVAVSTTSSALINNAAPIFSVEAPAINLTGNVIITGNLIVTGDVSDFGGSLGILRTDYNEHIHPFGSGNPPTPQDV